MILEQAQRELLAKLACTVLTGEHALLPERLTLWTRHCPLHWDDPFGIVIAVPPMLVIPAELLLRQPTPTSVDQHLGLVEAGRRRERRPDRHVATPRDVDPDPGALGQGTDGLGVELAATGRDEVELPGVLPRSAATEGDVPVAAVPGRALARLAATRRLLLVSGQPRPGQVPAALVLEIGEEHRVDRHAERTQVVDDPLRTRVEFSGD